MPAVVFFSSLKSETPLLLLLLLLLLLEGSYRCMCSSQLTLHGSSRRLESCTAGKQQQETQQLLAM
jgi:hypothetical protein